MPTEQQVVTNAHELVERRVRSLEVRVTRGTAGPGGGDQHVQLHSDPCSVVVDRRHGRKLPICKGPGLFDTQFQQWPDHDRQNPPASTTRPVALIRSICS